MPGTPTDPNVASPATEIVCEGVVDGVEGTCLRGWAWIPAQPALRLAIEASADGVTLARGDASAFRADLAAAGKAGGHCAFALGLDPMPPPGTRLHVAAIDPAGARHTLAGSPCIVAAPPQLRAPGAEPDVLPVPLRTASLQGSLDQCGPLGVRGWVAFTDGRPDLPELALYADGRELLRCKAEQWRDDVATRLHHDGSCGFEATLPAALRDGAMHAIDLRLAASGESLLARPLAMRTSVAPALHLPLPLERGPVRAALTLSVIVNFHDMRREAERTLTSLTSAYQRDIDTLEYEVLCIDNASQVPLDAGWIAGFGPQFRLIRSTAPAASPCAALNQAALEARGRYLALMIDGAHVLTPGVLRETLAAWREDPRAVIALRHWFVGGDQRWLAAAGYTRQSEDSLFERIHWPNNGYEMFRIGAPIGEQPEPWFDGLTESNCLLLPTALFDRIGGFDAAFTEPGGGFANLDLWRRASDAAEGALVALVGEASFHQFHHGTTTNVPDAAKDANVRRYAADYERLRGQAFQGVHRRRLRFRGRMGSEHSVGIRQRPLLPMDAAITDRIRHGVAARHFDAGAREYLQSSWAECGLADDVTWLGQATGVAASDLNAIQKILCARHPDAIVAVGTQPGLVEFVAATLDAGHFASQIIHVPPMSDLGAPADGNAGVARNAALQANVRRRLGGAENVLVVLACPAHTSLDVATLEAWGALVSHRSWLVCTGTVFGQPWLGYAVQRHLDAIRDFVSRDGSAFVIDPSANRQWVTACPGGFLRKTGGSIAAGAYDAALDAPVSTGIPELSA